MTTSCKCLVCTVYFLGRSHGIDEERDRVVKHLRSHAAGHDHGGEDQKADVLREKAHQISRGDHEDP